MHQKLCLTLLLLGATNYFANGILYIESSPNAWNYGSGFWGGLRAISDTDMTQRVTDIELGLDSAGAVFNFRVLSPGVTVSA
jgi:hypothetical protein